MPDFDHPPNGLVELGQIITSPKIPSRRLGIPLPIQNIQTNKKTNYQECITRARRGELGLWLQFLASIAGVGPDIAVKWARENSDVLEFRELEASFFEPENDYIQRSVAASKEIKEHLKKTPGKSLYIITGVKVARGAKRIVHANRSGGIEASIALDATPFIGAPIQLGPRFEFENARHEKFRFEGSSDFIFAYRLSRIIPKPHGTFETKKHERGAQTLRNESSDEYVEDVDEDHEANEASNATDVKIIGYMLDSSDYGANPATLPFEAESMIVKDELDDQLGDNACTFIIPNTQED